MKILSFRVSLLILITYYWCTPAVFGQSWINGLGNDPAAITVYSTKTVTDRNGYIISTGFTWGAADFSIGSFSFGANCFVMKSDSLQNVLWALPVHGPICRITSVTADDAGNVYVLGAFEGDTLTIGSVTIYEYDDTITSVICRFMAKINPAGTVEWIKRLTGDIAHGSGFNGGIGIDEANHIYVSLAFNSHLDSIDTHYLYNASLPLASDIYIAKFDTLGNCFWVKTFGGDLSDGPMALAVSPAGNFCMIGQYNSPSLSIGATTLTDASLGYKTFIARFDSSGNALWVTPIDSSLTLTDIAVSHDGEIYVTGFDTVSVSLGGTTLYGALLLDYNASGTQMWARSVANGKSYSVAVDACGNVWFAGQMTDTMTFPDGQQLSANFSVSQPLFLATYNKCGDYRPHSAASLANGSANTSITVDNRANVYLASDHQDTLTVGASFLPAPAASDRYFYVARYNYYPIPCGCDALEVSNVAANTTIFIFPNPTSKTINISSPYNIITVTLTDIVGHIINTYHYANHNNEEIQLDVSALSPGMYFVKVDGTEMRKLIKQ